MPNRKAILTKVQPLIKSVWLFPIILAVLFITLTTLKIHGSSIGIYHDFLFGTKQQDPNLLLGQPRDIRSDEWIVNTQLALAQKEAGYPRFNENLGSGRDMSLLIDVPYKEWSAVFKPQNLAFLALPFEYAFALKWWFMFFALAASCYFFCLKILGSHRQLLATLLALSFALSPFVFWWYQTVTIMPLVYGFLLCIFAMRLIDRSVYSAIKNKWVSYGLDTAFLAYSVAAFAMVLYPPFQVPVMFSVFFFILGYLLNKRSEGIKQLLWQVLPLIIGVTIGMVFVLLFMFSRADVISSIQNTAYPGARVVLSGELNPYYVFTGIVQPFLQKMSLAMRYFANQSEAANFISLAPFILLPCLLLVVKNFLTRNKDWLFAGMTLAVLLIFVWLFIPNVDAAFKPFFFELVPPKRMLIGLGFAGFILLILFIKKLQADKVPGFWQKRFLVPYLAVCFLVIAAVAIVTRRHWPQFASSLPLLISFCVGYMAIVGTLLFRKFVVFGVLLLLFSAGSIMFIHPVYRGIGPVQGELSNHIRAVSDDGESWAVVGSSTYQNMAAISGRHSLTGIQHYPDNQLWEKTFGEEYAFFYNRYAHIVFGVDPKEKERIVLAAPDSIVMQFSCKEELIREIDFLLSVDTKLELACLKEVDQVRYPNATFWIYKIRK